MKRILTFWLPISALLCFLSFVVFKGLDPILGIKPTPVATSNEDIYRELQEPLIGTIMYNGATFRGDREKAQIFEYSFKGCMTDLPYRITLSRNAQFNDCTGCIGDWEVGMFSPPEYNGEFISLKEFIIQMVHANENIDDENAPVSTMFWQTDGFIWKITPENDNKYLIEVTSSSDKKWIVRV